MNVELSPRVLNRLQQQAELIGISVESLVEGILITEASRCNLSILREIVGVSSSSEKSKEAA